MSSTSTVTPASFWWLSQSIPDLGEQGLALVFSFSSASEAVWGLHLKVLVYPAEGDEEGGPRHGSNTSGQSPKATCMEHHPFPAAESCLKEPHIHPSPRSAVGAGSLLQAQHTASPWSRHSPRAHMDVFPFNALLLLLLPESHGVGFQPRRSRGSLPALPRKKSSPGESGMFHQPALHQEGVQHPPCITAPSLPLLPQKEPVLPHKELVKKIIWFGKILDHIKIQVALSELENPVLYISL